MQQAATRTPVSCYANPFASDPLSPDDLGRRLLVGREDELAKIQRRLYTPPRCVTIEGQNGIGKTSIVNVAAYDALQRFLRRPDPPPETPGGQGPTTTPAPTNPTTMPTPAGPGETPPVPTDGATPPVQPTPIPSTPVQPPPVQPPAAPSHRLRNAGIGLTIGGVLLAGGGGALLGVDGHYGTDCWMPGDPTTCPNLYRTIKPGVALVAVGGAALVAGVVLMIVDHKRSRSLETRSPQVAGLGAFSLVPLAR